MNWLADLRFNENALGINEKETEESIQKLKKEIEEIGINWNSNWGKKSLALINCYKKEISNVNIPPFDISSSLDDHPFGSSAKNKKSQKVMKELGFSRVRNVRGDGNCGYRSIFCGYIEKLLTQPSESAIKDFLQLLENSDDKVFSFSTHEEKKHKTDVVPILKKIVEAREKLGILKSLHEFYLNTLSSDVMTKGLIMILRNVMARYLKEELYKIKNSAEATKSFKTNINVSLNLEGKTLDIYNKNIILKDGAEAQGLTHMIVPILLRINLCIVPYDSLEDISPKADTLERWKYEAGNSGISYKREDGLNFADKTLYILHKTGHFYSLIREETDQLLNCYQECDQAFKTIFSRLGVETKHGAEYKKIAKL